MVADYLCEIKKIEFRQGTSRKLLLFVYMKGLQVRLYRTPKKRRPVSNFYIARFAGNFNRLEKLNFINVHQRKMASYNLIFSYLSNKELAVQQYLEEITSMLGSAEVSALL